MGISGYLYYIIYVVTYAGVMLTNFGLAIFILVSTSPQGQHAATSPTSSHQPSHQPAATIAQSPPPFPLFIHSAAPATAAAG